MTEKQIELYYNQIDICYRNVKWSHRTHERAADIYGVISNWVKLAQLILSFIVGWDVLSQMRADSPVISWILIFSAALLALLQTISKTFDFEKLKNEHVSTAKSLWDLRENYMSLMYDLQNGLFDTEGFKEKRDELQSVALEIYKHEPRTFSWAYNRAEKDFKKGLDTFEHLETK